MFVRHNPAGTTESLIPSAFIDESTLTATISLISFSSQYGIGSYIKISATFGPVVSASYSINHMGGLQGGRLTKDRVLCIIGLALGLVTSIYLARLYANGWYVRRFGSKAGALGVGLLDTICLTVGPILYLVIRLVRTAHAESRLDDTFQELTNLRWASQTLTAVEKLEEYSAARGTLEDKLNEAEHYQTIGVILARLMYDPRSSNHRRSGDAP